MPDVWSGQGRAGWLGWCHLRHVSLSFLGLLRPHRKVPTRFWMLTDLQLCIVST